MRNNRMLNESIRMLELSGESPEKIEALKKQLLSKVENKTIKENSNLLSEDDIDDFDIFDVDDDSDGLSDEQQDEKIKQTDTWNYSDDIPKELKLALLTDPSRGVDKQKAINAGFSTNDFIERNELTTDRKTAGLDVGGETVWIDKIARNLYNINKIEDFEDATNKGKVFIKTPDTSFYKWLTTKDLNAIGINKDTGKISKEGNATLNFLARVLSGKGLRDGEQGLIELAGKENSKNQSLKILSDFYNVSATNFLPPLLDIERTPENLDNIVDGVTKGLLNLAGISGQNLTKKDTNWNGNSNVGPWILQVAKNDVKDKLKRDTEKLGVASQGAEEFLNKMLKDEGVITIVSSKEPSHEHFASKVEKVGKKYHYLYDNVEDAIDDLKASSSVPAHHMKVEYVSTVDYKPLYGSQRLAPIPMSREMEKSVASQVSDKSFGVEDFDKSSENEVKNLLGDAVEFMSKDVKKYGLSKKHSTELNPDSNVVKAAKSNIINFIYNFLLGAVGESATSVIKDTNPDSPTYGEDIRVYDSSKSKNLVRDIEESGKINSEVMKTWIDSQNKKMINALKSKSDKTEEELKVLAKKAGLLINDDDKSVQNIWKGFKDYLEQNPSTLDKIMSLIGLTSPEGYEQDVQLALEQKIRAKIQKILRESFIIKEEEEDFEDNIEDLDYQIKVFSDRYADKYGFSDKKEVLDSEIKNVIYNGDSKYGYLNNANVFKYMTHIMAMLWNNLDESKKRNVNNYIVKNLYSGDKFKNYLISKLERKVSLPRNKVEEIIEDSMIRDKEGSGILPPEAAMNNFNPKVGASYLDWLAATIIQMGGSRQQKEPEFSGGEKVYHTSYLDAPVGGSDDEGNERTVLDVLADTSSTEDIEKVENPLKRAWEYIGKFLQDNNKLKGPQLEMFPLIIDPETQKQSEKGGFSPSIAANIMDISDGNARAIYNRIKNSIKQALLDPSEELIDFVKEKTGINLKNTKIYKDNVEIVAESKLKRLKNLTKENIDLLREFYIK